MSAFFYYLIVEQNEQSSLAKPMDSLTNPQLHQWYFPSESGLLNVETEEDEGTIFTALSIAYEYLINATKRKITWSLSL